MIERQIGKSRKELTAEAINRCKTNIKLTVKLKLAV